MDTPEETKTTAQVGRSELEKRCHLMRSLLNKIKYFSMLIVYSTYVTHINIFSKFLFKQGTAVYDDFIL